jgi:hypothetical protein
VYPDSVPCACHTWIDGVLWRTAHHAADSTLHLHTRFLEGHNALYIYPATMYAATARTWVGDVVWGTAHHVAHCLVYQVLKPRLHERRLQKSEASDLACVVNPLRLLLGLSLCSVTHGS